MTQPTKPTWRTYDDQCLDDLRRIGEQIKSTAFSLELLCGRWERMSDEEVEPMTEQLRETFAAVNELFEEFKELQEQAYA